MPIVVNLDVMMAKRKISAGELAERVDITPANLSILKNNKAKAVRFSTLEAICRELDCQPGDVLEYVTEEYWKTTISLYTTNRTRARRGRNRRQAASSQCSVQQRCLCGS